MNNGLLLLIEKNTDTLIDQTRTSPQKTLEFQMNKQMERFSFNPPINLAEESKWPLAATISETNNSIFNTTIVNNKFSHSTPGY